MPSRSNQKLKPHFLVKILEEHSDEDHPLTAKDLIDHLGHYDISAERKSLYDDIERLQVSGVPIELHKGNSNGYYISERPFEYAELKLMVDAVHSSRFLTAKKSDQLVYRIAALGGTHQATRLRRYIRSGSAKPANEGIIYALDAINTAIDSHKQISFLYFDYNYKKERVFRRDGKPYIASPVALVRSEDKYYLVAFSSKYKDLAHYRVDRMSGVEVLMEEADRDGIGKFDVESYTRSMFFMHKGESARATFVFEPDLVNVFLDRFGHGIHMKQEADGLISLNTEVTLSPTFCSWLLQFGTRAKIKEPQKVKDYFRAYLSEVQAEY